MRAQWSYAAADVDSWVEDTLLRVLVRGRLKLSDQADFGGRIHAQAERGKTDAVVVDMRDCVVEFTHDEAVLAAGPVAKAEKVATKPIAMVVVEHDLERYTAYAAGMSESGAVRRAFVVLAAAESWAIDKGRVWRKQILRDALHRRL